MEVYTSIPARFDNFVASLQQGCDEESGCFQHRTKTRKRLHVARGHPLAAARAREVRLADSAAGPVAESDECPVLARLVLGAPLHQAEQDGIEVESLLGEPVLEALRPILIFAAFEDPVADERLETVGEDVPGEACIPLELAEAANAEEALAQDEQRLAVADDRGGRLERAVLTAETLPDHWRSIDELQNKTNSCRVGFRMQPTREEHAMESAAPDRYRVVTWQDPAALHRAAHELTGLELLHRIAGHQLPPPPVADLLGFEPTFVSPGLVVFAYEPREEHYNALGTVHGGIVTTILDTAMSCAVHSELESGVAYATVELKTSFVRPVTLATGPLRAEGRVVHQGSRIATAEAKLLDVAGTLYATSSSTAMILAGRRAKLLAA